MRIVHGKLLKVTNDDIALDGHFTVPVGVTSIEGFAFYSCTRLTSLTIPKGVTSIGDWVFRDCTSLTALTIPVGVTSIGCFAFNRCTSITAITILVGVTRIGEYAFNRCTSLTVLTIPEGVARIEKTAFSGCTSLKHIVVDGNDALELDRIKVMLPLELRSKVVSKQHYIAEENRLLCEATALPVDLMALTQEYIAPLTSGEIKSFVSAKAKAAEAKSFQLSRSKAAAPDRFFNRQLAAAPQGSTPERALMDPGASPT